MSAEATRDETAERGLLAAFFADPDLLDVHRVERDAWTLPLHVDVHAAMLDLRKRGEHVDHASVATALRASGALTGGGDRVFEIARSLMPWIDAARFADVVVRLRQARRDRDRAQVAAGMFALGDRARGVEVLAQIQNESEADASLTIRSIDDLVRDESARRLKREAAPDPDAKPDLVVPYHHPVLDGALGGKRAGHCVIVGADTNVGKTHFAIGEANAARAAGLVAGVVSCEDPDDIFAGRELDMWHERGGLPPSGPAWWLANVDEPTVERVVRAMVGLVTRHGAQFLVVDYIQAIENPRAENRRLAIRDAAARLKQCAKRLRVPLLMLSQLTVEKPMHRKGGGDPRAELLARGPSKNDLRDSRDLAHIAEVVVVLWRAADFDAAPVRAKVAKAKSGGLGRRCWYSRGPGGALVPEQGYPPPEELEQPPTKKQTGYQVGGFGDDDRWEDRDAAE